MTRQQMIAQTLEVLEALANDLAENAADPTSSVPTDACETLMKARAIVKTFGPVVAMERDIA